MSKAAQLKHPPEEPSSWYMPQWGRNFARAYIRAGRTFDSDLVGGSTSDRVDDRVDLKAYEGAQGSASGYCFRPDDPALRPVKMVMGLRGTSRASIQHGYVLLRSGQRMRLTGRVYNDAYENRVADLYSQATRKNFQEFEKAILELDDELHVLSPEDRREAVSRAVRRFGPNWRNISITHRAGEIDNPDPTGIPAVAEWRRWYGDEDENELDDEDDGIGPITVPTRRQPGLMPLLSQQLSGRFPPGLGPFGGSVQTDPTGMFWRPYNVPYAPVFANSTQFGPAFQHTGHDFAQQGSAPMGWGPVGSLQIPGIGSVGSLPRSTRVTQAQDKSLEDRYNRIAAQVGHLEDKMSPADDAMVEFTYALDQDGIINAAARINNGDRKGDWTLLIPYEGNIAGVKDTVRTLLQELQEAYKGYLRIYEESDAKEGAVYRFQNAPTEASRAAAAAKVAKAANELQANQVVPTEVAAGIAVGATFGGPIGGIVGGLVGAAAGLLRSSQ